MSLSKDISLHGLDSFIQIEAEEKIQEECGIVLMYNPAQEYAGSNIQLAYLAGLGLQHRGQVGGGAVYVDEKREFVERRREGLLRDAFYDPEKDTKPGEREFSMSDNANIVAFQCRYGTNGGYDKSHLQPCEGVTVHGERFFQLSNGQYTNVEETRRRLQTYIPLDANDTYVKTQEISETKGDTRDEIVVNAFNDSNGAFSSGLVFDDALYLARDRQGIRPFYLGHVGKDGWIAASETHALEKIRVPVEREIAPGEIIRIDARGLTVLQEGSYNDEHFCDFELDYFSRPDSLYDPRGSHGKPLPPEQWQAILSFRERCGELLAQQAQLDLDLVIGIPDSGVPVGTGYARGNNSPYRQLILRDHYDPNGDNRLFQGDQNMKGIASKVIRKLSIIPDRSLWKGKRVGLVDDSIIRANVSRNLTDVLQELGASEVHWLSGFPMVQATCHLGVSMRTKEELVAARHNGRVADIAKEIGATSVHFITPENFIRAKRGNNMVIPEDSREIFLRNGGCGGCVTSIYPISPDGVVYELKKEEYALK